MYTDRLVQPNLGTILIGKENETYAIKTIREVYNLDPDKNGIEYELYEHCSGDINDRKKGQDIVLKIPNQDPIYFQVKPFVGEDIEFYDSGDRGYYFKVASWHNQNKYKGENVDVRLRPSFFPFVEPGFEIDLKKGDKWFELLGAGMVHPNVLKAGGIDSNVYSGFAFGWGVERCFSMKSGLNIDDLRLMYKNDLRFNEQF
jgi:hypothetical protein